MKVKDPHPRLLYPAKLSFRMEGQLKRFPDEVKFKTMNSKMTTNSNYQQLNLKTNKQTKKNKQTRTVTEMEITWRVISGEWDGGEWEERYRE